MLPSRRAACESPPVTRREELFALARATKGFMPDDEGETLAKVEHEVKLHSSRTGHSPTVVVIRENFWTADLDGPDKLADHDRQLLEG